jgi:hypothetical protein
VRALEQPGQIANAVHHADDHDLRLTAEDDEIAKDAMKEEIALCHIMPGVAHSGKANQFFEFMKDAGFNVDSRLFAGGSHQVCGDVI